jgi:hypothetical protein
MAQGVLCRGDPSVGLLRRFLSHCPQGLILMASTPSHTTIPNWVSGEQLLYKQITILQLKESDDMKRTCATDRTEPDAIQRKHPLVSQGQGFH